MLHCECDQISGLEAEGAGVASALSKF